MFGISLLGLPVAVIMMARGHRLVPQLIDLGLVLLCNFLAKLIVARWLILAATIGMARAHSAPVATQALRRAALRSPSCG